MDIRRAGPDETLSVLEFVRSVYVRSGLLAAHAVYPHWARWDDVETTILVAEEGGELVGTVSITMDSENGLPVDLDYKDEVDRVRHDDRRLACVWRLAGVGIELSKASWKELVAMGGPDVVLQCHPRHRWFYTRRFGFCHLASRANTHGLQNAPSCLMYGRSEVYAKHG